MGVNIKGLYSADSLHAGMLLEQEKMDWATVAQSIHCVIGNANHKHKGLIENSLVLICKREMADLLKSLKADLKVITLAESYSAPIERKTLTCIVVDGDLPNHYIILTDMDQWQTFLLNGGLPHRALIAMKGFKPQQKRVEVGFEGSVPNEYLFMTIVREHEFDGDVHNPLKNIVLHSDYMLMALTSKGIVRNDMLLGSVPVHMTYEKERAIEVDLHFHNGLIVTLMKMSK